MKTCYFKQFVILFQKLQQQLPLFQRFLEKQGLNKFLDTDAFALALEKGLYFDANIPTGYGVGSSGALCVVHILGKLKKLGELK